MNPLQKAIRMFAIKATLVCMALAITFFIIGLIIGYAI